eukprot:scaffold59540_cov58-Phaeocystis_antarctica.AAC.5
MLLQHGRVHVPAPLWAFAPCSLSNSLSSYGQYQAPPPSRCSCRQTLSTPPFARTSPYTPALRYVSFPLQTLSKSAKIIPVMLMGRLLNGKTYPCVEFVEAGLISLGVSLFSFSEKTKEGQHGQSAVLAVPQPRCPGLPGRTRQAPGCAPHSSGAPQPLRHQWQRMVLPAACAKVADLSVLAIQEGGSETQLLGLLMLALYVVADSFTSQWQSRVYREHPTVDQFQAMFAVNTRAARRGRALADATVPAGEPRRHLGQCADLGHLGLGPALHLLYHPPIRAGGLHHHDDHPPDVLDGHLGLRLRARAASARLPRRRAGLWRALLPDKAREARLTRGHVLALYPVPMPAPHLADAGVPYMRASSLRTQQPMTT